jgi:hypothetical protein
MRRSALSVLLLAAALLTSPALGQQQSSCFGRDIPEEAWIPTAVTHEFTPVRLLIIKAFWQSGTEALLIDDPQQVRQMFDLVADNATVGHACGYHWELVFEGAQRQLMKHLHNKDCETYRFFDQEIHSRLTSYFYRIENAPTHFLLEVALDPRADPEKVATLLEGDGRRAFFLQHPDMRFPRLRIIRSARGVAPGGAGEQAEAAIKAKALERTNAAIQLLVSKEKARLFEQPRQKMASYVDGRIEIAMEATVVLPLQFDEARLQQYANEIGPGADADETLKDLATVKESFVRPAEYILSVVSPEPYSRALEERLRRLSPAILRVTVPAEESLN